MKSQQNQIHKTEKKNRQPYARNYTRASLCWYASLGCVSRDVVGTGVGRRRQIKAGGPRDKGKHRRAEPTRATITIADAHVHRSALPYSTAHCFNCTVQVQGRGFENERFWYAKRCGYAEGWREKVHPAGVGVRSLPACCDAAATGPRPRSSGNTATRFNNLTTMVVEVIVGFRATLRSVRIHCNKSIFQQSLSSPTEVDNNQFNHRTDTSKFKSQEKIENSWVLRSDQTWSQSETQDGTWRALPLADVGTLWSAHADKIMHTKDNLGKDVVLHSSRAYRGAFACTCARNYATRAPIEIRRPFRVWVLNGDSIDWVSDGRSWNMLV